MNIISNLIFHCNHCYANTAFITIHDSTAPRRVGLVVYLTQHLCLRGRPPPIIFTRIVRPMNALQLCRWQFSHRCYGRGAMSENRAKINDIAQTRSLLSKISDRRGRPPPIIAAPIVRPMNALQLCAWQFSHGCHGWGATNENRSKIGDFTPTRSLWSKISGTRSRPTNNFCKIS